MFGDNHDQEIDAFAKYNRLPDKPQEDNIHEPSDHDYHGHLEENDNSSSTARRQEFKLTISEYEEIAQRYEESNQLLDVIRDALESKENLKNMRERVERDCE